MTPDPISDEARKCAEHIFEVTKKYVPASLIQPWLDAYAKGVLRTELNRTIEILLAVEAMPLHVSQQDFHMIVNEITRLKDLTK